MLVVLIERHVPLHLLRSGIDLHGAAQRSDGAQHLARHASHRTIGSQRDALPAAVAVLDDRLVSPEIEGGNERPRAVGGRQWGRLPSARGQTQRRVLKLGLGRSEHHRQLAQELRVGVQRVAGGAPLLIEKPRPRG